LDGRTGKHFKKRWRFTQAGGAFNEIAKDVYPQDWPRKVRIYTRERKQFNHSYIDPSTALLLRQ
jgi:hypothetical protein